jgi:folate-binding protein YgfZ
VSLLFDLSQRTKLRVAGADCERFLNGQLTNNVRKASEGSAIQACVLNNKGKLNGHLFFTKEQGAFLIDTDAELRDSLEPRLERYIIADDVEIEDVTERFAIFHVLGQEKPELPNDCKSRESNRFGERGHDIWAKAEQHDELLRLLSEQFGFCDEDGAELLRIERGIPRWGRELSEEVIPIEANLEDQTIDYEKGCYIGQEVISRMKMSGQTNKRLCGLLGANLLPGMKLVTATPEAKEVGWVTSVSRRQGSLPPIALGFVKRGFNSPGTQLRGLSAATPEASITVQVTGLPFSR